MKALLAILLIAFVSGCGRIEEDAPQTMRRCRFDAMKVGLSLDENGCLVPSEDL